MNLRYIHNQISFKLLAGILVFVLPTGLVRSQETPFSRGVNLTNWFQEDNIRKVQFTKYTKQDFSDIKSLGFDVIRLPINLHFMTDGAPDYTLDPIFLLLLDQVVDWAEELEIHLILDNHTFDNTVDTDPAVEIPLLKVWSQMAGHFRERSEYLYYEVLNEPHGISDSQWNSIQADVVEEIRKSDTKHYIVVGPAGWNSYNNLDNMPEYEDEKLIYTFHFYDPFLFTHQGASWVDPSMEEVKDIPFPYDAENMPGVPEIYVGTWIGSSYSSYPVDGTMKKMKELLQMAVEFRSQRSVPVYCGEFGVYMPTSREEYRVPYYDSLTHYLGSLGIAWTMWDYHGGFGLFEEGTDGLFDHDLNIPLLEAMGANIPEQTEYIRVPDSAGFILYDDYIAHRIVEASWPKGIADFYSTDHPNNGNYCIHWTGASLYEAIVFNISPDRDLSRLVDEDYALDCMVRGSDPGISFDMRFLDTKTDNPDDLPWRMTTRVDGTRVDFDGNWHHMHIPLNSFWESGAWYEEWYNPRGEYDWSAVDRFEIVPEVTDLGGDHVWFDNIHITNMDTARVNPDTSGQNLSIHSLLSGEPFTVQLFPNPSPGEITLFCPSAGRLEYSLTEISGRLLCAGSFEERTRLDLSGYRDGIYLLHFHHGREFQPPRKLIIQRE
jgi:endoglucanase